MTTRPGSPRPVRQSRFPHAGFTFVTLIEVDVSTDSVTLPELALWSLSPEYVAVTVSLPEGSVDVVQVAAPGLPEVTAVIPQPVSRSTPPSLSRFAAASKPFARRARPLTSPYSPLMVAVNLTDWPEVEGFAFDVTDVVEVASVMVKLLLCVLLEPV